MVVRVFRSAVSGASERTRQELGSAFVDAGALALVVPNGPVAFLKEFLEMNASALR